MDDRQMKKTVQRAFETSLSDLRDDPRLAERVLLAAHGKGKEKVKKKLSAGLALAMTLMIVFGGIAAALALNPFEWFGQGDHQQRLNVIASGSQIDPPITTVIPSEEWGDPTVSFTHAYYDGGALLIGYTIANREHIETFTPTEEQKAGMQIDNEPLFRAFMSEAELAFADAYDQAVREGVPFGMMKSTVSLHREWRNEDGASLGGWDSNEEDAGGGITLFTCDFHSLPEGAQHQESITVRTSAMRRVEALYFDGENTYRSAEEFELVPLALTVGSFPIETRVFEGATQIGGVDATVIATASAVRMTVLIDAHAAPIPPFPDDHEVFIDLTDANGQELVYESTIDLTDETRIVATFPGTGEAPDSLIAWLGVTGWEGTEYIKIELSRVQ